MLKINRAERTFALLPSRQFQDAGIKERYDLQAMIRNSPDAFFDEMGEDLMLLAEELKPAEFVDDRIDLLALDRSGAVVVIELKRGSHRLQLLQSLAYASMIDDWEPANLIKQRAELTKRELNESQVELEDFLETDPENINETQRIILIAEAFDYEVLTTARWLSQRYEIDIRCYRLSLSSDSASDLLTCTCIFPPAEISHHATSRRQGSRVNRVVQWTTWDEAMKGIKNPSIVQFYQDELAHGQESYLLKRILQYRHGSKRRWNVTARRDDAYVWQIGRFENDVAFWSNIISAKEEVKPVKDGSCLRFFLRTSDDFVAFKNAIKSTLTGTQFTDRTVPPEENEDV